MKAYQIVMTGFAGVSGAGLIAEKKIGELRKRFPVFLIRNAVIDGQRNYGEDLLSFLKENGNDYEIAELERVGEGGVFKGLWNLGESADTGFSVDLKSIPIKQETVEICNFFDINPYELYSDGVFLILARDGYTLAEDLERSGIPAAVIGRTHPLKKRVVCNNDEERFLEPRRGDSLVNV